ncbi:MAG: hypothetical protein VW378_01940 [bacterium]
MSIIKKILKRFKNKIHKKRVVPKLNLINDYAHKEYYNQYYSKNAETTKILKKLSSEYKAKPLDSNLKILSLIAVPGNFTQIYYQQFIAYALALRDCNISHLTCSGSENQCASGRILQPSQSCSDCLKYGQNFLDNVVNNNQIKSYADFNLDTTLTSEFEKIGTLSFEELRKYTYKNIMFGKYIEEALNGYFLNCHLSQNPIVIQKFKEMLIYDLTAYNAFIKYHHQETFDRVIMCGGVGPGYSGILNACKQSNIPCLTWEVWEGNTLNSVVWTKNDIASNFKVFNNKKELDNYSIDHTKQKMCTDYLMERVKGSKNTLSYNNQNTTLENVISSKFGNIFNKPFTLLLTTVPWDANCFRKDHLFKSQYYWILETIKFFKEKPEETLVIRAHPAESHKSVNPYRYTQETILSFLRQHIDVLPENIIFIDSNDDVSTYALFPYTKVALIFATTTIYELIYNNIPVICASKTHHINMGISIDPKNKKEYFNLLDNIDSLKVTDEQKSRSLKYAYKYLFERMIPYSQILNTRCLDDLKTGSNIHLDKICRDIIVANNT